MKTIAIDYTYEGEDYRLLVKALYNHTLKDDPLFCFFFGRNRLVITISTEQCWHETVTFLRRKDIAFEEYSGRCPLTQKPKTAKSSGALLT